MPLNGMTKAYRAYIRERRYWRRRQRIEANRPVPSEEDDYQGPRAVGGQVTVINRERILGQRLANRDMPVVVPETQEHGPVEQPRGPVHTRRRHPDIDLHPDDSTPSLISDSESIELNTQEEGPTPAVERQDAVGHEARANVRRNAQEDEPLVPRANPAVQNVTVNVEQDEENNVGNMHIPVPIVIRFPAQQNGQDVDDLAERLSEASSSLSGSSDGSIDFGEVEDVLDESVDNSDTEPDTNDQDDLTVPNAAPINLHFYEDEELNLYVRDFIRTYTKGRMTRSQGVEMWNLVKRHSRYDPDEMKSFDTMERRMNEVIPQSKTYWKVRERATDEVHTGEGVAFPENKFRDRRRYEILRIWTRLQLEDLIRFHAANHTNNCDFVVEDKIRYDKVHMDMTFDGIPYGKSSSSNLTVMAVRFRGCKRVYILQVRVAKRSEAKDIDEFLCRFVDETLRLGVTVDYFLGDAPMRAFLKCLKGHAGRYSCELCEAEGQLVNRKICYPACMVHQRKRTNERWEECVIDLEEQRENGANITSVRGITGRSPLMSLKDFDMVKKCPPDPMHRDWLGLAKSNLWKATVGIGKSGVMNARGQRIQSAISAVYEQLQLPNEFSHRARTIDYPNFKSHEWKSLCICTFPTICEVVSSECGEGLAHVWLLFIFLILVYHGPEWLYHELGEEYLREMQEKFYDEFQLEMGSGACTFNVHAFFHMPEVRKLGNPADISTEPFESAYGLVQKSYSPGTRNVGKQIIRNMLLRSMNIGPNHCNRSLIMAPVEKDDVNFNDSYVMDDTFHFYKVTRVFADRVNAAKIKTSHWACPTDTTLPMHKVGVFKYNGVEADSSSYPMDYFTGKAVLLQGKIIIGLHKTLLFS